MIFEFSIIFVLLFVFNQSIKKYISIANKYKIISVPKKRDSHEIEKPKGAGIIFYIIIILYLIISIILDFDKKIYHSLLIYSLPLIVLFSFLDDIYDINWKYKISIDLITSFIILYLFNHYFFFKIEIEYYIYLLIPLFLLILSWFINLINFSDGSDGYLSFITLISFVINLIVKKFYNIELNYFNLLFVFLLFIFLYYNFFKSQIFLGDSGSRLIAIIFIVNILFDYINFNINISLIWLLSLLIILLDTGITLTQRIFINKKILEEHKDHTYQILANKFNHKTSVYWLIGNVLIVVIPSIYFFIHEIIQFKYILFSLIIFFSFQIFLIKNKYK